jgi:hypothetical protein
LIGGVFREAENPAQEAAGEGRGFICHFVRE